jgi:hypothetical protein
MSKLLKSSTLLCTIHNIKQIIEISIAVVTKCPAVSCLTLVMLSFSGHVALYKLQQAKITPRICTGMSATLGKSHREI